MFRNNKTICPSERCRYKLGYVYKKRNKCMCTSHHNTIWREREGEGDGVGQEKQRERERDRQTHVNQLEKPRFEV